MEQETRAMVKEKRMHSRGIRWGIAVVGAAVVVSGAVAVSSLVDTPAVRAQDARPGSIALTVYNQNFGLVKDVRTLQLERGRQELRIDDVAAFIDPTSVHFKALDHPGEVVVFEQNYKYDIADAERLLSRYLNQTVTVLMKEGSNREGTLLSYDGASLVLSADKGAAIVNRAEVRDIQLGSVPGGLVVKPTLVWTLESGRSGSERAEVSYLTDNISWHAEYVAVVNEKETGLDLNGWVSLDNRSGAAYENAKLKLVAGDVRRVPPPMMPVAQDMRMMREEALAGKAAPEFQERGFFEYHIYELDQPATVADRETKQLALFPAASAAVTKVLTYDGARMPQNVQVRLEFENSKANGLGMALPAGKVRVFKEDEDGALEFAGEDAVDHTPRDEKVRLYLGNAFDLVGERKRTNYEELGERSREESFEIELRNHKDEAVVVTVVEHLYGEWRITASSHDYKKKDAETVEFQVPVPANQNVKVTYTARMKW
jgi:hypothetical protein